jgi:hypothetical protein
MSVDKEIREIKQAIKILAYETPFKETVSGDRYAVSDRVQVLRDMIKRWEDNTEVTQKDVEDAYINGFLAGKKQAQEEVKKGENDNV